MIVRPQPLRFDQWWSQPFQMCNWLYSLVKVFWGLQMVTVEPDLWQPLAATILWISLLFSWSRCWLENFIYFTNLPHHYNTSTFIFFFFFLSLEERHIISPLFLPSKKKPLENHQSLSLSSTSSHYSTHAMTSESKTLLCPRSAAADLMKMGWHFIVPWHSAIMQWRTKTFWHPWREKWSSGSL